MEAKNQTEAFVDTSEQVMLRSFLFAGLFATIVHTIAAQDNPDDVLPPHSQSNTSLTVQPQAVCAAINSTKCDGSNTGACRTDCSPDPHASEAECHAKGCCWQEVRDADGNPTQGYPWYLPPG